MPIRFHAGALTRLLCAEPGTDSQMQNVLDVVNPSYDPKPPWKSLGVAKQDPVLTIRSGLRAIVFNLTGDWPTLEALGVSMQFAIALMQAQDGHLLVALAPASIAYHEVVVVGDEFRGRVDIDFLGDPRMLEVHG